MTKYMFFVLRLVVVVVVGVLLMFIGRGMFFTVVVFW